MVYAALTIAAIVDIALAALMVAVSGWHRRACRMAAAGGRAIGTRDSGALLMPLSAAAL
jgi:hypothetical protein